VTTDTQTPRTTCVVVHCGDLDGGRLERRLRSVLSTAPKSVRVVATVLARRRLSPGTARRVDLVVVRDGGAGLIAAEVARPQDVVVLPLAARVSGNWLMVCTERLSADPTTTGVLPLADQHVFAYPAAVTSLDGERVEWPPVDGLSGRSAGRAPSGPTLGAVLIVKDEEASLAECLRALEGVVDEVVVYDTGSSDSTVDIARAHGASVVEGFWDADFSAARNRALAHATCVWVLSVDADEVLVTQGGGAAVKRWLAAARGDAALVPVVSPSTTGATTGNEIRAVRLFRRVGATWTGALHEQVVPAPGAPEWTACTTLPPMHLLHSGYVVGHERAAEKAVRNLEIAETAYRTLSRDDEAWPEAAVAYARALGQAERGDECIEVLRGVVDCEVTDGNVVQAARGVVPLLVQRGLFDEAVRWTERAAGAGEAPGMTALRQALVRFGRGEQWAAVGVLRQLVEGGASAGGADLWNRPFDGDLAVTTLADLEVAVGQSSAAATRMVELMLASPGAVSVGTLLRSVTAAGGELDELASHTPDSLVERSVREVAVVAPELALEWVSALARVHPTDPRALVAGSVLAARTSVEAALEWSVRVREAGLDELCPLRVIGVDVDLHPRSRLFALGLLHHGLGDRSLDDELRALSAAVDPADGEQVLAQLRRYAPDAVLLESSAA